jgi:hypothetical protein
MATIGPVKLALKVQGDTATVDVTYDIKFSATDVKNKQGYDEECRIIGDDTNPSDAAAGAGGDDTLEFVTPVFNKPVKAGDSNTVSRHHTKSFRALDLNEDLGNIPNPDEIRARVVLTPAAPSKRKPTQRESPMVKLKMG